MAKELQAKKRQNAEEHLKKVSKHLTKTFFRRSINYTDAATHLQLAGDAYRATGDWKLAKKTFYRAIDAYHHDGAILCGGELYEKVAKVAIQQLRETSGSSADKPALITEVMCAYESASAIYFQFSSISKASDALVKAASACEDNGMADEAKELYARACALVRTDDQTWYASLVFPKALEFLVKIRSYKEAREIVKRQIEVFRNDGHDHNVAKSYVNDLVLLFAMHDVATANEVVALQCQEADFLRRDEFALAKDLIQAYKTSDEELLKTTTRKKKVDFLKSKQIARTRA